MIEHRLPDWAQVVPHPVQNLGSMRALLEDAFDASSERCLLGSSECILVLVADGFSFDVARACWSPDRLGSLTSTFPSTTSTALMTANTGRSPAEHGVLGVAFFDPQIDAVFDCYRDTASRFGEQDLSISEHDLSMGPWPTVFTALSQRADCVAHVGALATPPSRWCRALVHGAQVVPPSVDWDAISDDPAAMMEAVIAEIESTLARKRSRPLLIWAHINLDSAIHLRGYDQAICDAARRIDSAAQRWASQGHTTVGYSDHGLVEIRDSDRARRLLALLNDPAYCRATTGGAGRTIWAYPRREAAYELRQRASELARDFAAVIDRETLNAFGAVGNTSLAQERIGDLVIVARGAEFPTLSQHHRFEHGALSWQEMIVPLATWHGR